MKTILLKTSMMLVALSATASAQSAITGTVLGSDSRAIDAVSVSAVRGDRTIAREATTDALGKFRLAPLAPGTYSISARKVGYRSAEHTGIRVAAGQTIDVVVTLTQAPRQLSTIQVITSPTSVDASTPELSLRLDRQFTELLPGARTASALIALVPGARRDQLWGGVPGVSNNYQLDGVAVNHPGIGGDFLGLSVDWIDALDIRGLGAGAEHGNFQGGIINAITRTGSNDRRYAVRTNYESPRLTASNFNIGEQGVEQAGRREVSGELLGPLARDRLFYFVAGQYVRRDLRSPDLATPAAHDFQQVREEQTDARSLAKITWLPALGHRVDLLGGVSGFGIEHAGINGVDDPSGTPRVSRPTTFYGLSWNNMRDARNQFLFHIAGFNAREARTGYLGADVPGVHVIQAGRQARFQNADFNELRDPRSLSAGAEWRSTVQFGTEHRLAMGAEATRGWWRDQRTRNAGLTWRPYPGEGAVFDPVDATTWSSVASEWGGDIRLNSDVASEAVFVQDHFALGPRLTLSPGIRHGHWSGFLRPNCDPPAGRAGCRRFEAVSADGFDPRIGIAWDVTGRNTFAVKGHWGRYHQGIHALFFDRAEGANVYSNRSFYNRSPPISRSDAVFTPAQRDAPGSGFDPFPTVSILDATGRVEGYRQPYVDQSMLAIEKSFGRSWKGEVVYTRRSNHDIVGLVDRNLFTNYTLVADVHVDNRYVRGVMLDARGNPLVLPYVYLANRDLKQVLADLNFMRVFPETLYGYPASYIRSLSWNPDVVLTAVDEAQRRYDQITMTLRTAQTSWRADGSITGARLRGNVPGVAGFGTTATRFSAGPFVNPNEAINSFGDLPDALLMEGKLWVTARLPFSMQGGFLYTHTIGERFTPSFELQGTYAYRHRGVTAMPDVAFRQSFGQSILLEPRGSRHFASRALVDARLEWRSPRRAVLTMDLFNVFGEDELVGIKTTVEDQFPDDPTTLFGAPRLRVAPRTLRLGLRFE